MLFINNKKSITVAEVLGRVCSVCERRVKVLNIANPCNRPSGEVEGAHVKNISYGARDGRFFCPAINFNLVFLTALIHTKQYFKMLLKFKRANVNGTVFYPKNNGRLNTTGSL